MYHCIIVDDEYYARKRVKCCIDWEKQNFTIAKEVSNIEDGLAFLENNKVHLAVVDITIQGKSSGLDFIAQAKKCCPDMVFIVLSGYSEFEYAREAMRYGVESYLTKPVNSTEMENAVNRAMQIIQQKEQQDLGVFWHNFFYSASIPLEQIDIKLRHFGLYPETQYIVLMGDFYTEKNSEYEEPLNQNIKILDWLKEEVPTKVIEINAFGHVIFILEATDTQQGTLLETLYKIETEYSEQNCFGYSTPKPGTAEGLRTAYKQASLTFLSKIFAHNKLHALNYHSQNDTEFFEKYNKQIELCLLALNTNQLKSRLGALLQKIHPNPLEAQTLETKLLRLLPVVKAYVFQHQTENHLTLANCQESTVSSTSLEQIVQRLNFFLFSFIADNRKGNHTTARLAQKANQIIKENFQNYEFGLEMLAIKMSVNPAYLSTQYKKHTGLSVTQQITKLRMEEVSKLLIEMDDNIQIVSELVGYTDVYYFSKSFKKYFGFTPSFYRNAQKEL